MNKWTDISDRLEPAWLLEYEAEGFSYFTGEGVSNEAIKVENVYVDFDHEDDMPDLYLSIIFYRNGKQHNLEVRSSKRDSPLTLSLSVKQEALEASDAESGEE